MEIELNNIYMGNCFDFFKKIEDNSIDITFTSPPYNRKRNDKYNYYDDNIDDYYEFLKKSINESIRISRKYTIFNLQKNYYNKKDIFKLFGYFYDKIVEVIIWEKTNPMPAAGKAITNAYEFFLVFAETPLKSNSTYTKNIVSYSVNSSMLKEHKAMMKQEISDWFIEKFTTDTDIVLDPFAGVGTTLISCEKYKRKYIGIELSNLYYEKAKKRIKKFKKENNNVFP